LRRETEELLVFLSIADLYKKGFANDTV
jgi:hypothetical protein